VDDPAAWASGVRALGSTAIVEVVPAEDTVVVICTAGAHADVGSLLDLVAPVDRPATAESAIEIDVVYDGADLSTVAELTGLSVEGVVSLHAAATYTVAFCGFSPGFAYLRGLDERLHIPRRSTPRTAVPTGSVAIAARYSAVYPSASPGGWHLLGRTGSPVWDVDEDPPARLDPGRTVKFRAVRP